jgi:hypothetical protein
MKAEHRKELETNTLAEGMGRLVQRMKERPRRSMVGYVIAAIAVFIALLLVLRWYHLSRLEATEYWAELEDGRKQLLDKLISKAATTNAGKAALLEKSWIVFWEEGMKGLGHSPNTAMDRLEKAYGDYSMAAELCAGNPTFEPEARYAMAIIEETKALIDGEKRLSSARDLYEQLHQKHEASAFGKLAGERAKLLRDETRRKQLQDFYRNLSSQLGLDRPALPKAGPGADAIRELEEKLKIKLPELTPKKE